MTNEQMSDKICPIMTDGKFKQYFSEKAEYMIVSCLREKCQWWWKCREPEKTKCSVCGKEFSEGESFCQLNGKVYCDQCFPKRSSYAEDK